MTHRASKPAFSAAIADAPSCPAVRSRSEKGYAYLMALFLVVTLMVASQIAVRNLVTEGRRQHEDEMIWRGQQYVRAIRLYYRKTGHYPSTLDDLKKGMPELHFLRYAAYRDPMKKDDGAWRFIYVNAAGQIIGSVKYATLQQMAILDMNGGAIPGAKPGDPSGQPGVPASSLADQSSSNSSNQAAQNPPPNGSSAPASAASTPPSSPDNSQNAASNPQNPASPQSGQNPQSASPSPTSAAGTPAGIGGVNTNLSNQSLAALAALKPTGPVDGPVLGGFLTGVGSSVDKASIRLYNGGKKYNQWEFIWNPVEDQAKALQQGMSNPQGTLPGQPGQAIGGGPAGTSIFGNSGPQAAPGAAASPNPGSAPASNPLQPGSTPQ